jgi:glycerol-3-phosphate dehydrogenase (NAD(P)+)
MTKILVLGAGVMGTALALPAASHTDNQVTLAGSPLDDDLIDAVQKTRHHPTLRVDVPDTIEALKLSELGAAHLRTADVIVIGVSSPGIDWVVELINDSAAAPELLALVTKGLVANPDDALPPLTYADYLQSAVPQVAGRIAGIAGPCIARELALGMPTRVTFASRDIEHARRLRTLLQTSRYRITTHADVVAVEACAALKNFLCIGVSAMISAYPLEDGHAKNPLAALYNQAVLELLILSRWISAASPAATGTTGSDVAFDLAGMGDLHVTVGGGRNSRLGTCLGAGRRLSDVIGNEMAGITVEGVDTGRRLAPGFSAACHSGALAADALPLTAAILHSIESDAAFDFDFTRLPG